MGRKWKFIVLLGIFFWPHMSWGAFDIEPRLLMREEFTDNLYLDNNDERSDFITTVAPGILLEYDSRLLDLELDYSLNFLKYLHHDEEDETSLSDTQRIRFRGALFPERDFLLTVTNEYQRVPIDERRQLEEDNPFVNKSNRNLLVFNPEYRYRRFSTLLPRAGYRYERADYNEPEGDDYYRHELYTDIEKRFTSRLSTTLGYRYSLFQAEEEEDYKRQDVYGGLSYQFSKTLVLKGGAGTAWLDYEKRSNETSLIWDVTLVWAPETRWEAGVSYKEDFNVSVNEGLFKSRRAEAFIRHLENLPWDLILFAEKQTFRTEDREDRSTGLKGKLTLPIITHLTLELTGEASMWRFLPERDDLLRYGAGVALSYHVKLGFLTAGYRYGQSNSDVDDNDYQRNLVFVQMLLTF